MPERFFGGLAAALKRLLVRAAAPEGRTEPVQRFDADGWVREQSARRQQQVTPDPFRGFNAPDPVFGWRREP